MFSKSFLSSAALAQLLFMAAAPVQAVDMSLFTADADVDPAFGSFVESFYTQAEDPSEEATTRFTAFFSADCPIVIGGNTTFVGKEGAAVFKVAIAGGNQFNHFPREAEVVTDGEDTIQFGLTGSAKETFPNGTCRATDFVTRWTMSKDAEGLAILTPESSAIAQLDLVQQSPKAGGCNSF